MDNTTSSVIYFRTTNIAQLYTTPLRFSINPIKKANYDLNSPLLEGRVPSAIPAVLRIGFIWLL